MPVIEGINIVTQPPINGFGRRALAKLDSVLNQSTSTQTIASIVHPEYSANIDIWEKWRLVYNCGEDFLEEYLKKFSDRESQEDFNRRKSITPTPGFATAAIDDIKNAIFQRTTDITRESGPNSYLSASNGNDGGVDLHNSTMNWFLGTKVIPELLTMAKVGVFVDSPIATGPTLADKGTNHPYIYTYQREDIRSWSYNDRGNLTSILLRDWIDEIEPQTGLPMGKTYRFRLAFLNTINTQVTITVALFDKEGKFLQSSTLNLPIIPFVIVGLTDSLLSRVVNHQVALLNLESADLAWILKAAYPIYTEQRDQSINSSHLSKRVVPAEVAEQLDLNCATDSTDSNDEEIRVGSGHGRAYGKGLERPGFIHPSSEPLSASMDKQKQLKEDIRLLVNLSLSNVRSIAASAESKQADLQGLESGLSYCGLELEHGERQIAYIWSLYENVQVPTTIKYPKNYSLKSDSDRLKEADDLQKSAFQIPSQTYRKLIQRKIARLRIGNDVSNSDLIKIESEIVNSDIPTADHDTLLEDVREGLVSKATASVGKGYDKSESTKAAKEHVKRLRQITISQSPKKNPASRGLPDLAANPVKEAREEKIDLPKRGPKQ